MKLVAPLIVLLFASSCVAGSIPQSDNDAFQLGVLYQRALTELLPIEAGSHLGFRYEPFASANAKTEYSCNFELELLGHERKEGSYRLHATLRVPKEPGLLGQLGSLLKSQPRQPPESLFGAVSIQRYDLSEETCPAIKTAHEEFFRATSGSTLFDLKKGPRTWMDGDRVYIDGYANEIFFTISVKQGNPLFAWAAETRLALDACIHAQE